MNGSIVVDIVFVAVAIGVIFSCGKNGFIGSIIHFFNTLIGFLRKSLQRIVNLGNLQLQAKKRQFL